LYHFLPFSGLDAFLKCICWSTSFTRFAARNNFKGYKQDFFQSKKN